jgi:glycosyltransferase involved in cell wall biosynthesis
VNYRICFITHASLERHATIKRAFGMAEPLMELGHHVYICLEDCVSNREAIGRLHGVTPLWFQAGGPRMERGQKSSRIADGEFDVVHICGLGFRNAIRRTVNPGATTIMDHVELESAFMDGSRIRRSAQYSLECWSLMHYSSHVVASTCLQDLWQERSARWGLKREVLYLPFAYEARWRSQLERLSGKKVRERFPGKKILVYMGGFYRAYGCYEMLQALQHLRRTRNDVVAVLCGRGPEYRAAVDFVSQNGLSNTVVMPGFVPESELMNYLAAADVLISPLQDTVRDRARCPSKLYEYMLTQRPIVTCRIGENGNALGGSGYYYQPANAVSMAAAMERALEGDRQEYPLERHSWMARVQHYTQWLDGLHLQGSLR